MRGQRASCGPLMTRARCANLQLSSCPAAPSCARCSGKYRFVLRMETRFCYDPPGWISYG
jgi:hypothetical protein